MKSGSSRPGFANEQPFRYIQDDKRYSRDQVIKALNISIKRKGYIMKFSTGRVVLLILSLLIASPFMTEAQQADFLPDAEYKSGIPDPASFLGYELGSDLTEHHRMVDYIHRLEEEAPGRVKVVKIGESQENRPIYLTIISSVENMKNLEKHRRAVSRLKDPVNTSPKEAQKIAAESPAISWMNFANDGEESAAFEAGLQLAYHFAAATDSETQSILDNSIIIINNAHNPDSHQRHVVWMKGMKVGKNGTADPNAAEHQADWLMSTSDTHYHIDSNRDAFALSQKESRIVSESLQHWSPQLWVDYHGEPEEYFFAPYAIPVNPHYPESVTQWAEVYGKNNGEAFDRFGWTYYAREVFDLHYPGYWDSYPAFNGAIGMTYETNGGGDKGFRYRKADGTIATLRNAIAHHVVAGVASARTTAQNRESLLRDYYDFFAQGMKEVENERVKQVALLPGERPNDTEDLVALLREHNIDVYRTNRVLSSRGVHYLSGESRDVELPAGTYIVPMAQPQKRLAKVLLERNVDIQKEFLKEARAAHEYNKSVGDNAPKESVGFYDVTAWSLPLTYGVEAYGLTSPVDKEWTRVTSDPDTESRVEKGKAGYAYIFSYDSNDAARLMSRLMAEGYRLAMATEPFTSNGKTYDRGVVVARVERNPDSLHDRIRVLAGETGTAVEAVKGAWTEKGILLGSRNVVNLQQPDILVLMDEPTNGRSYGALWYTLEKRYETPFTALRVQDFNGINLHEYDVVVMPPGSEGGYKRMLDEQGIAKLKSWVRAGGTFVGIKQGAAFAADDRVNLTTSRLLGENSDSVYVAPTPGSIFRVNLDLRHFLSLGYDGQVPVHINSDFIFTPSEEGANVGVFDAAPKVSGFVFEENRSNFRGNAYLVHEQVGAGDVVLFADQPVFRLYWRGLERLFMNSVLLTPSF